MNDRTCDNCRFSMERSRGVECHRFPPTRFGDGHSVRTMWPEVYGSDWCGEFAPVPPQDSSR